jgi:hypothetical protein
MTHRGFTMASEALFQALAEAGSRPSKALRAVQSAGQAGEGIIGGYMQGKELGQKLDQYRLLSTPLGSMYPDPSQIPFGLGPQHTVKDLLTIAPAMENYVPPNLIRGAAQSFGAPTNDAPASTRVPGPPNPPTQPGTANLDAIEGPGNGSQSTLPPGTSPAINVPPGGMGMKAFQNVVMPTMKAGQEERHFQTTQANEDRRQQNQLSAERNRTMAGETAKIAPSLTEAGTIQDDINALLPLYKGYSPTPFLGTTLANVTAKSGSSSFGSQTMQTGKQIQQIVPALAAKVNYLLNKRFNSGEAAMLQSQVVPNASDDQANAMQKIGNLRRLTMVMQGGDINALKMVASSIAGRPISPVLPSSGGGEPTQSPQNTGTGDPEADQAIQRIQSSGLNPQAKQARIMAVKARVRPRGTF